MKAIDRALGVECVHCHTIDDWKKDDKPAFAFAGRMMKMVDGVNEGTLRGIGAVTCWSCHRGNAKPARMPRAGWEERLAKWPDALTLSAEDAKKPARGLSQRAGDGECAGRRLRDDDERVCRGAGRFLRSLPCSGALGVGRQRGQADGAGDAAIV